jgi:hypothetical protein
LESRANERGVISHSAEWTLLGDDCTKDPWEGDMLKIWRRAGSRVWALFHIAVLIGLASAVDVTAQESGSAAVTGTIVDGTGSMVPGATITATEVGTGVLRAAYSNERGVFRLSALPSGEYSLTVELTGFAPVGVSAFRLQSGEVRDLGKLTLQVGGQAEEVTVTAEVTPVQVATSARTASVTSEQLTNIQMRGRDAYGLLAIVPGVQDTNLNRNFTSWRSGHGVSVNGAPVENRDVMIDGFSAVDEGGPGTVIVNPNVDAIGEMQVIANGYTAENGRNNGGLVNIVTKSGTSQLRGSAWYNGQRDQWNANDFFRKREGLPKPFSRVNISGYSVGGPVVIPKLFDSRTSERKLFFFGSQEYTDDVRPSEVVRANLPTEAERRGDFSNTRLPDGSIQPIIDPLTGAPFPGNVIPQNRMHPTGQAMLDLMPPPNGVRNPVPGQEFNSNSAYDTTPEHGRTNHVLRIDGVLNNNVRASVKYLRDRDDDWNHNRIAPGVGWANQFTPGWVFSGNVTTVLSSTMVAEFNAGVGLNRWGFEGDWDYRDYYCQNLGVCPPRLEPFGPHSDPPELGSTQQDEWPYMATMLFDGGDRAGLSRFNSGGWATGSASRVLPAANHSKRASFSGTLTKTAGAHTLKGGFYFEWLSKTEPGSGNYMGNFDFGHEPTNPLSTGNGYANALLGIFSSYTELSDRVDRDARHKQIEGFVQDTWKVTPRFTLDYGVRLTHSGAFYEVNNMTAAFYPELYDPANAPRLYRPVCLDGRPGTEPCPTELRGAIDPANPGEILSFAFVGNIVPGSGDQLNGMQRGGRTGNGDYWDLPPLMAAPRIGFAWDLTGDAKTALRSSWGIFYNLPRTSGTISPSQFIGNAPVTFNRIIRNASIDDVASVAGESSDVLVVENPVSSDIATLDGKEYELPIAYNANVAIQRDIGFHTTVEAAYVMNLIRNDYREIPLNPIPLYAYADPKNQFNGEALDANFLRTAYRGMGEVGDVVSGVDSLTYHSLQLKAERRLAGGLQFGAAYTYSRAEGMQGYDPYTEQLGGEEALRARYWGPTELDRPHNLVVHYSYMIPNPTPNTPVLKAVLGDWLVAGVTKFLSGAPANPTCSSNNSGLANADPTLTGLAEITGEDASARCMLTGDPVDSGFTVDPDPAVAVHFNPNAFAMAQPFSPTEGNFGNAPLNMLRHPSWSSWDLTLERRFPLRMLSPSANVRVQFQAYNLFNQVEFIELDADFDFTGPNNSVINSTDTGRYVDVIPPRILALTFRVEF